MDSGTWRVDACAFDLGTGTAGERRPAVVIPQELGVPDGLAVDAEGNVWVAVLNSRDDDGVVLRCDPRTGDVVGRVNVPGAGMVTACAFGGADLHELCITTIADLQNPARQPNGGRVFRVRVPVAGQPEHLWKNQERSKS